jgi:hypothetical protein
VRWLFFDFDTFQKELFTLNKPDPETTTGRTSAQLFLDFILGMTILTDNAGGKSLEMQFRTGADSVLAQHVPVELNRIINDAGKRTYNQVDIGYTGSLGFFSVSDSYVKYVFGYCQFVHSQIIYQIRQKDAIYEFHQQLMIE